MPRKGKGIYVKYDRKKIDDAVSAVKAGMSYRKAAAQFGIPKSTIRDRITGRVEEGANLGRPPVIPESVESEFVDKVLNCAEKGFGLSRRQMLNKAGQLCDRMNLKTPFKNKVPGKDWFRGLKNRHPEVVVRKPMKLSTMRARSMSPSVVSSYFSELNNLCHTLPPDAIWNMDETGIQFEHTPQKVDNKLCLVNRCKISFQIFHMKVIKYDMSLFDTHTSNGGLLHLHSAPVIAHTHAYRPVLITCTQSNT